MPAVQLSEKKMLVIGGAGGIGRAIVKRSLEEGARVEVWDRALPPDDSPYRVQGVAYRQVEAATEAEVFEAFEALESRHALPDILVNAAGIFTHLAPLASVSLSGFRKVLENNVVSCFLCCREALRRCSEGLVIINISSALSERPIPMAGAYSASKASIDSLTRSIAVEYGPNGVRANAVNPGPVEGKMLDEGVQEIASALGCSPSAIAGRMLESVPLGRLISPQEVAALVVFLAGEDASSINGQTINICGGYAL
jgi:NAD(P)-dependent dehydrogenase (short-subunit alcohol dehydrogenase family)